MLVSRHEASHVAGQHGLTAASVAELAVASSAATRTRRNALRARMDGWTDVADGRSTSRAAISNALEFSMSQSAASLSQGCGCDGTDADVGAPSGPPEPISTKVTWERVVRLY